MIFIIYSILLLQSPVEALLDKGFAAYENEAYDQAISFYNEASQIDDQNPEIFFLRGLAYNGLEDNKKAIEDLEYAIKLDPQYGEAYQQLGIIYLVGQAPGEAIKAFDKAIELDPELAELYVNRGTAKCMKDDKKGAEADWETAKKLGVSYSDYMTCD